MMAKDLTYNKEARKALLSGAEKLAKTVGVTMGPQGKNVILGKFVGAPVLTKDGVTVAREVTLKDPVEELSCQLIKEAAGRTAAVAGDGTTTATVLAHEIFKRGNELINDNYSPLYFKRGLEWAVNKVTENLNKMATEVENLETLRSIATISANNDSEIGDRIAEAFNTVGLDGTVVAEASPGQETSVRFVDGIEFESGFVTPAFITDEGKSDVSIDNCNILIYNDELTSMASCLNLFNDLSNNNLPVLVLAKAIKQEALATFVTNNKLGRLKVVAVNLPSSHLQSEWLDAMSIVVGAKVFGPETGSLLSDAKVSDLGFAKKVVVNKYLTKILEGKKDEKRLEEKLDIYYNDLDKLIGDTARMDVKRRIAFLKNKAAVVSVGYSTELELREKADRVDDSICATRAAQEEGFVPGGGVALLRAANKVSLRGLDKKLAPAAKVLLDACVRPITQIVENAFEDPEVVIKEVLKSKNVNFGYNAASGDFEDLVVAGVIDPKKVSRIALENAASISLLLINTEAIVSEQKENPSSWQPPAGWRPPNEGGLEHKY